MITEFVDSGSVSAHDQFQAWRTNHQGGLFLTLATRTRANLHGARCYHLGSGPPYFSLEDGFGSLTVKRKVCGSEEELLAWAAENGVSAKRCLHCLRDNLIGDGLTQGAKEEPRLPEEIAGDSGYSEGGVQRMLANHYERDSRAREACIRHFGTTCLVCGFDFVATYGEMMTGFIHVHHLEALSSVGQNHKVDPINDLRPVCPNCHAVLHSRKPPFSLAEVRQFLQAHEGSAATAKNTA
jgi:5-methylcytosine-specific restriction endonuclease McrA